MFSKKFILCAIFLLALPYCHAGWFSSEETEENDDAQPILAKSSGFISGYNETCDTERTCNSAKNLECDTSSQTCQCATSSPTKLVYVTDTEGCEPIAEPRSGSCEHDAQCQYGRWGLLSRCEKSTARCQCYDMTTGGKKQVHYYEHDIPNQPFCFLAKLVGDSCSTDLECRGGIEGEALCHPDSDGTKRCKCDTGYAHVGPKCIQLWNGNDNFRCNTHEQCKRSSLGQLSKCEKNGNDGKCICWDNLHPGVENVVRYEKTKTCYAKKNFGDKCDEDDECRASLKEDSECRGSMASPPGEGEYPIPGGHTCQCKEGKSCDPNGASSLVAGCIVSLVVMFMGVCMW